MKNLKQTALNALLSLQRFSWEQGVTVQAAFECEEYKLLAQLVKSAVYRSAQEGRPAQMGYEDSATDACCVGEGLVYLAEHAAEKEKEWYESALNKLLNWAVQNAPRSEKGIVYHMISVKEFWIDSMYMLPPFLAAAGQYQEAVKQIDGYIEALYDGEAGLFRHIWSEEKGIFTDGSFWGVGNGWALAGIARVIDLLPQEKAEEKERLIVFGKKLLDKVLSYMLSSGRFFNVLDDASSFEEVNLSQMTAYTICRGIRCGWLEEKRYLGAARLMRAAALREVDEDGFVHNVCGMPYFDQPGVAPEGQAFLVMMENEFEKMEVRA